MLDESADYRDAMAAADSMLSDLGSLATEFLLTGRPLLYLHRTDGPGPSAEGGYLHETDVATEWSQVEAWLREVPTRASDPAARREPARSLVPDGRRPRRPAGRRRPRRLAARRACCSTTTTSPRRVPRC
ncbi:hypothetical protein GCM10025868_41310 [Angustibacter aerolatus]|uniref:Uncharacterized protein n=1 Tax=Angustibacter aerolatus TaxID=1162965 RepID=A0ABQ6JQD0_9ACTN|nr:hypothetical protein GCM10025868_41310 [Angustibacter aerolatus]